MAETTHTAEPAVRAAIDTAVLAAISGSELAEDAARLLAKHCPAVAREALANAVFDTYHSLPQRERAAALAAAALADATQRRFDPRTLQTVLEACVEGDGLPAGMSERRAIACAVALEAGLLLVAAPEDPKGEWRMVAATLVTPTRYPY